MNRRNFVTTLGTQGLMLSGLGPLLAVGEKRDMTDYGTNNKKERITKIGEWSLQDIRDIFHEEFYKNNLPIWRNHVVDWEYGGYIPHIVPILTERENWNLQIKGCITRGVVSGCIHTSIPMLKRTNFT